MNKGLYGLFALGAVCLVGCVEGPYAVSTGSFALRKNDPIIKCTIIEEGTKKEVSHVCFFHDGYEKKKYNNKKYTKDEGGVHAWIRTYSEVNKKITAFEGSVDLTKIAKIRVKEKCGSRIYAPETERGIRYLWVMVTNKQGEEKEYLFPESTVVRFKDKDGNPGGIPLIEIEEMIDIRRSLEDMPVFGP